MNTCIHHGLYLCVIFKYFQNTNSPQYWKYQVGPVVKHSSADRWIDISNSVCGSFISFHALLGHILTRVWDIHGVTTVAAFRCDTAQGTVHVFVVAKVRA